MLISTCLHVKVLKINLHWHFHEHEYDCCTCMFDTTTQKTLTHFQKSKSKKRKYVTKLWTETNSYIISIINYLTGAAVSFLIFPPCITASADTGMMSRSFFSISPSRSKPKAFARSREATTHLCISSLKTASRWVSVFVAFAIPAILILSLWLPALWTCVKINSHSSGDD